MRGSRLALFALLGASAAVSASTIKTVTVTPTTTRVDGTVLPPEDIEKHAIECRRGEDGEWEFRMEILMPSLSEAHDFVPAGNWICRGYTVDVYGQWSDPGGEYPFVSLPARPNPPSIVVASSSD